jgi:hypothetical protein
VLLPEGPSGPWPCSTSRHVSPGPLSRIPADCLLLPIVCKGVLIYWGHRTANPQSWRWHMWKCAAHTHWRLSIHPRWGEFRRCLVEWLSSRWILQFWCSFYTLWFSSSLVLQTWRSRGHPELFLCSTSPNHSISKTWHSPLYFRILLLYILGNHLPLTHIIWTIP